MAGRVARLLLAAHLILIAWVGLSSQAAAFVELMVNGQPAGEKGVALHLGRLMLAVPVLQEHLGVTVTQEDDEIHLQLGSRSLTVRMDSLHGWLDGQPVELDVPPVLSSQGVLVPLRTVADILGLKVDFHAARGTLQLSGAVAPAPAQETPETASEAEPPSGRAGRRSEESGLPERSPQDDARQDEASPALDTEASPMTAGLEARLVSLEERRQELERRRLERMALREKLLSRALRADSLPAEPGTQEVFPWDEPAVLWDQHPGQELPRLPALEVSHGLDPEDGPSLPLPDASGADPALEAVADVPLPQLETVHPQPDHPQPVHSSQPIHPSQPVISLQPVGSELDQRPSSQPQRGPEPDPGGEDPAGPPEPLPLRRVFGVDLDASGSRPRIVLRGDGPLEWNSHLLRDPERLVIDIPGAQWIGQSLSRLFEGPIVRRVRASQFQPDSVRVVLDLHGAVRFQAEPDAQGLALTLHQQVGAVYVWESPSGPVIDLAASGPLWGRFSVLHEPYRLVIDFPQATLVTGSLEGEASLAGITRWRISQYEPDTVRLVLELARPLTVREHRFYPARAEEPSGRGWPGYAGIYRLQLGPALAGVGVTMLPNGVALIIEGESALEYQVSRLMAPERVVVDLPGAVLPADWAPVELDGGQGVQQVRVGRNRTDLVRVVIDTHQPMRYQVHRSADQRRLVMTLEPSAMAGTLVVLDAGHGGHDRGAIGVSGLMEADVNLELALKLGRRLREEGAQVVWTRTTDTFLPLPDRPQVANELGADVFISIHNNSCPENCIGAGTETFYLPLREENRLLAQALQEALVQLLGLPDRGIKERNFSVLRHSEVPAALVEVAFLSNPEEEALLRDPAFIDQAVEALVEGVRRYVADAASLPRPLDAGDPRVAHIVQRMLDQGLEAAQYVVGQDFAHGPRDRRPEPGWEPAAGGWTAQAESSQGEG